MELWYAIWVPFWPKLNQRQVSVPVLFESQNINMNCMTYVVIDVTCIWMTQIVSTIIILTKKPLSVCFQHQVISISLSFPLFISLSLSSPLSLSLSLSLSHLSPLISLPPLWFLCLYLSPLFLSLSFPLFISLRPSFSPSPSLFISIFPPSFSHPPHYLYIFPPHSIPLLPSFYLPTPSFSIQCVCVGTTLLQRFDLGHWCQWPTYLYKELFRKLYWGTYNQWPNNYNRYHIPSYSTPFFVSLSFFPYLYLLSLSLSSSFSPSPCFSLSLSPLSLSLPLVLTISFIFSLSLYLPPLSRSPSPFIFIFIFISLSLSLSLPLPYLFPLPLSSRNFLLLSSLSSLFLLYLFPLSLSPCTPLLVIYLLSPSLVSLCQSPSSLLSLCQLPPLCPGSSSPALLLPSVSISPSLHQSTPFPLLLSFFLLPFSLSISSPSLPLVSVSGWLSFFFSLPPSLSLYPPLLHPSFPSPVVLLRILQLLC